MSEHATATARAEVGRRKDRSTSRGRRIIALLLAVSTIALLIRIATAYLDPDLRQAILSSGFGLC